MVLVGYWAFDGSAKDGSGHGNDLTLFQSPSFVESPYRQAVHFNGSNQYGHRLAVSGLNVSAFSFGCFVKGVTTSSTFRHVLGFHGGHNATFYLYPNTFALVYKFNSLGGVLHERVIGTISTEVFKHVFVTYDGQFLRSYLDAVLIDEVEQTGDLSVTDNSLFVGNVGTGSTPAGNWCNIIVDELRYYDSAIPQLEIAKIANGVVRTQSPTRLNPPSRIVPV